jgi:hypothetical protein
MSRRASITILALGFLGLVPLFADFGGGGASPQWGALRKVIYIQDGTSISAWNLSGRYTTYYEMVPVGDGTYLAKVDLYPGEYNFAFFALTDASAPTGLLPNTTYWDAAPSSGKDIAFIGSVSSETIVNTGDVSYISIGGNARRYLKIPDGATNYFVYCNWASTPVVPGDFRARPGNGYVSLNWGYPYAYWGNSEEAKAIDVIVGGCYQILRSSEGPAGPYSLVASTPGYCSGYIDSSVSNGTEYYYILVASDAYRGSASQGDVNLSSQSVPKFSRPDTPIPMRFRVEDIDFEKVRKNSYLVWLTPEGSDRYDRSNKICGRIVRVKSKEKLFGLFWMPI